MTISMPMCFTCKKKPANTYRQIDGRYLCKKCFSDWIIDLVEKTITHKNLFQRNDRIIVGLSGGKDSTVLLNILVKIEDKFPSELIAVCIDEGITGYRDTGIPIAEMNAKKLGVEFRLFSFKDFFGYTLDEIVNRSRELQTKVHPSKQQKIIQQGPCSFCGVLRRKALNIVARQLNGDKLATGHNLNDVTQTILLNLLRGDPARLISGELSPIKKDESFVPRVKPLQSIAERDIILFAFYNGINYHSVECPYSIEAMRLDARNFLIEIEDKYPGTLNCIKNSMDTITQMYNNSKNNLQDKQLHYKSDHIFHCKICSEPSSNEVCKSCEFLQALFKIEKL